MLKKFFSWISNLFKKKQPQIEAPQPQTESKPVETVTVEIKQPEPIVIETPPPPTPQPKPLSPALQGYLNDYNTAQIRPEWVAQIKMCAERLEAGMPRYEAVSKLSGVNPYMIGLIHMMECGFNFSRHLHNGDPLSRRTVRVPANRPSKGNPPFTWEESALDALEGRSKVQTLPEILMYLENYNGVGYKRHGVKTPYLWSGTTLYSKGKYVSDGRFDPMAVSKQVGCAAVLKQLGAEKVLT